VIRGSQGELFLSAANQHSCSSYLSDSRDCAHGARRTAHGARCTAHYSSSLRPETGRRRHVTNAPVILAFRAGAAATRKNGTAASYLCSTKTPCYILLQFVSSIGRWQAQLS